MRIADRPYSLLLLPYVKRLSNEYYIDVFCLKASLPIKGYVSKNFS